MKTIEINLYKFSELSEDAKDKAREWWSSGGVDHDWYECIYEGAENIGLKITEFELNHRSIDGYFDLSASEVAANIFRDHGEECETFKTATAFMEEWEPKFAEYMQTEEGEDDLIYLGDEFRKSLLEDYLILLQRELDFLGSREYIDDILEVNEYDFTEDGEIY